MKDNALKQLAPFKSSTYILLHCLLLSVFELRKLDKLHLTGNHQKYLAELHPDLNK